MTVCVFYLTRHDYDSPPWCREKVMVYYYYITNIRIRIASADLHAQIFAYAFASADLEILASDTSLIHTYAGMLTFCATAIIYYIIINSSYAFIKSTNMIYHNCVYQSDVYYMNQMCQGHILIPKPLKCL